MSNSLKEMSIEWKVIVLICVASLIYFIFKLISKNKDAIQTKSKTNLNKKTETIQNIMNKLTELQKELFPKYVSYYVNHLANEKQLDRTLINELYVKYGKVCNTPRVKWNDTFSFLKTDLYLLDESISKWLTQKGYQVDSEIQANHNFVNYLKKISKEKAVEDLKVFISETT